MIQQSQMTVEDISFAETVGVNRGVKIKIFHEKEQALQWLDNECQHFGLKRSAEI